MYLTLVTRAEANHGSVSPLIVTPDLKAAIQAARNVMINGDEEAIRFF